MTIMATKVTGAERVATAVEAAVCGALVPLAQSNAAGIAQAVRTAIVDLGVLSSPEQELVGGIELALDNALDPRSKANAVGASELVRAALG